MILKSLNKHNWLNKFKSLNPGLLNWWQLPGRTLTEHVPVWPRIQDCTHCATHILKAMN